VKFAERVLRDKQDPFDTGPVPHAQLVRDAKERNSKPKAERDWDVNATVRSLRTPEPKEKSGKTDLIPRARKHLEKLGYPYDFKCETWVPFPAPGHMKDLMAMDLLCWGPAGILLCQVTSRSHAASHRTKIEKWRFQLGKWKEAGGKVLLLTFVTGEAGSAREEWF